ncbi:hypothetical protein HCH_03614 [Hahella chejuensis KCTC 2396]|uniref:Uncharacterized protein n=1 Tax=Hahella chejuensis (strain KCTC 2396) TaxID=349521 RepID=Q2SG70_HAHCH|nr:hypothetical protein [Hahella chejuensis]ABC30354.1 hypothetical protein HCH_03614 [Hahella chejuensis KCTC 2396]
MKTKAMILATLMATSYAMTTNASEQGGGYLWEKKAEQKEQSAAKSGDSTASQMGHTAVQHKRWLFDDAPSSDTQS